GSRTWLNNFRMAMARVLEAEATPVVGWTRFLAALPAWWQGRMTPDSFVTEFIGPNMGWQYEWDQLRESGHLPAGGGMLDRVGKRLAWQAVSEFTYLGNRGRTLDRIGMATLSPPADALDQVAVKLAETLSEQFG